MLSASMSRKRSLSPSLSASGGDVKRRKESTPGPEIVYKVKWAKNPPFKWAKNLTLYAFVAESEDIHCEDPAGIAEEEEGHQEEDLPNDDQSVVDSSSPSDTESDDELVLIGYVKARIISRRAKRKKARRDEEYPSQGTPRPPFDLFYSYGFLDDDYVAARTADNAAGYILQIEHISVHPTRPRHDTVINMLEKTVEEVQKVKTVDFAFAWPAYLDNSVRRNFPHNNAKDRLEQDETISVALFRKAGYRTVTSFVWFALSIDLTHPSQSMTHDQTPQRLQSPGALTQPGTFKEQFDLWRSKRGDQWFCVDFSAKCQSFPPWTVKKLLGLRGLPGPMTTLTFTRARYGCTCGECIAGIISPRMRYTMLAQAEIKHDMIKDEIEENSIGSDDGDWDKCWTLGLMTFGIDEEVVWDMEEDREMCEGFGNLLTLIASCLRAWQLPTVPNILLAADTSSEFGPDARNYLMGGGTVEAVLRGLVDICEDDDKEWDEGSFNDVFKDDLDSLAECKNDREFGFVLGMLLDQPGSCPMSVVTGH